MRFYAKMPLEVRFWNSVESMDPEPERCWEWKNTPSQIYGMIKMNGKFLRAHRVAYEITYGSIPDGWLVCHQCDNPRCVRPSHLFLGTHKDNSQDCVQKGRFAEQKGRPGPKGERSPASKHPERYRAENNGRAKLDWEAVRSLREEYATGGVKQSDLAKKYGICQTAVSAIVRGLHWREDGENDNNNKP